MKVDMTLVLHMSAGYASRLCQSFLMYLNSAVDCVGPQTEDLSVHLSVIMLSIVVYWGQTDPQKENLQQTNPHFQSVHSKKSRFIL